MQIKTNPNRVQKSQSFIYGTFRWVECTAVPTLEVVYKRARIADSFVVSVDVKDLVTTSYPNDVSSLFRCGETNYFSSMHIVELTVFAVESA